MDPVTIIGSGASGVHFAQTLLDKGYPVTMLDVGHAKPPAVRPDQDFAGLKRTLPDPAEYFLGKDYEAVILPGNKSEYYGFPPSKSYIFEPVAQFRHRSEGFAPLFSFAAGGLAEAWTGGCYPFSDGDLEDFPFDYAGIEPYYSLVARRIGVTGTQDDLTGHFPLHDGLAAPLDLDAHSARLLQDYERKRSALNRRHGFLMGRSRLAVTGVDRDGRSGCCYSGRCLWGCPKKSIYTPSVTLAALQQHPNFRYIPGVYASHFRYEAGGRVSSVVVNTARGGEAEQMPVGTLVLAAGALGTARLVLESIYRDTGKIAVLGGLMDNRQVLLPFVNLKMVGRRYEPQSYQYHQLAIGVPGADAASYVHGLVTTLKTALIHPVAQTLPVDLATGLRIFRQIHAALGLVNINFSDFRREENQLTLERTGEQGDLALKIRYAPEAGEAARITANIRLFQSALWQLGCFAPGFMSHVRPMGASVHYAGIIPMTDSGGNGPMTATALGQSREFPNVYFADGTTFPSLPAKNLTFTLMANATRIASLAF